MVRHNSCMAACIMLGGRHQHVGGSTVGMRSQDPRFSVARSACAAALAQVPTMRAELCAQRLFATCGCVAWYHTRCLLLVTVSRLQRPSHHSTARSQPSKVLHHACVRPPLQTYLEQNEGAGLQHMALKTNDIFATLRQMAARSRCGGFDFMPRPSDKYYKDLPARIVSTAHSEVQGLGAGQGQRAAARSARVRGEQ